MTAGPAPLGGRLARGARLVIGVIHLLPLPGAPRWGGDFAAVLDRARADLLALAAGGVDAAIVENFGDAPFRPGAVEPETVAALARVLTELRPLTALPLGVNVLRNDAAAALALAAVCAGPGAFIRVNVHVGAMVTDQGVIEGRADRTLRRRRELGAEAVAILADVLVKHAAPLGGLPIEDAARDATERGLADALIVTGAGTGRATDLGDVRRVRAALPDVPLLVGSGVTAETVRETLALADGVIAGTALKACGVTTAPVDVERVRRFVAAAKKGLRTQD
ncbi:MAG TPA: BtpA/SgcQ family protein [Thermomicrobiales bacterium]|nr:BtpA/SgcQ family protein [Thermomicrobiales bacterium]